MNITRMKLLQYSLAHFLVDFACIFFMYRYWGANSSVISVYLVYNFCAFALQMPVGLLADRYRHTAAYASLGCILIAAVYIMEDLTYGLSLKEGWFFPILIIILGLGNCFFHVGAGLDVLDHSKGKNGPLGAFISPGAFGIYLGASLSGKSIAVSVTVAALLIVAGSMIRLKQIELQKTEVRKEKEAVSFQYPEYRCRFAILICLFLVVCLRSYLGGILRFDWKDAGWGAWLTAAVVSGKIAGGYLADRFGSKRAAVVSLGLSGVLFMFSSFALPGVLAVFFFNMTMPITLGEAARQLPKSKGLAFGTLTFALFLGILPIESQWTIRLQNPIGYAALAVVSLLFLWIGLRKEKRTEWN